MSNQGQENQLEEKKAKKILYDKLRYQKKKQQTEEEDFQAPMEMDSSEFISENFDELDADNSPPYYEKIIQKTYEGTQEIYRLIHELKTNLDSSKNGGGNAQENEVINKNILHLECLVRNCIDTVNNKKDDKKNEDYFEEIKKMNYSNYQTICAELSASESRFKSRILTQFSFAFMFLFTLLVGVIYFRFLDIEEATKGIRKRNQELEAFHDDLNVLMCNGGKFSLTKDAIRKICR